MHVDRYTHRLPYVHQQLTYNNNSAEIKCKHCSDETIIGDLDRKEEYGIPLCCNYVF